MTLLRLGQLCDRDSDARDEPGFRHQIAPFRTVGPHGSSKGDAHGRVGRFVTEDFIS